MWHLPSVCLGKIMKGRLQKFRDDLSISAFIAGLLAVLISYAGPLVIVFQAAKLSGLSTQMTSSWIWAISIGSGITGLALSWKLKVPVITAWSTPGAALLIGLLPHTPYPEAIGAYLVSALVITLIGFSFRIINKITHIYNSKIKCYALSSLCIKHCNFLECCYPINICDFFSPSSKYCSILAPYLRYIIPC